MFPILILLLAGQSSAQGTEACVAVSGHLMSQVQSQLSRRAVDVLRRARAEDWRNDGRLGVLVAPDAQFGSGVGHIGIPLPTGVEGARELARLIDADRFRFSSWSYLDGPANGCARQDISVEFYGSTTGRSWPVKFTFSEGRVVVAETWERYMTSGLIADETD